MPDLNQFLVGTVDIKQYLLSETCFKNYSKNRNFGSTLYSDMILFNMQETANLSLPISLRSTGIPKYPLIFVLKESVLCSIYGIYT